MVFKEWGSVCPGCTRRVVDEMGRERLGRRRGGMVGAWMGGVAGRWVGEGGEGRERIVVERRERGRWDGGGRWEDWF